MFTSEGSTWIKVLRGEWQTLGELKHIWQKTGLPNVRPDAETCRMELSPIYDVLHKYSEENKKRPTPELEKYLFFETRDVNGNLVIKASVQDNTPWGIPTWSQK
ncbi:hypothetical protein FRC02_004812, partial [Tulasnella sp. 418]